MEPRHIRHFLAAARHGSLRNAAEAAGVSQPALTKSIRRLEAELGVALFERHPKGVRLSAFGAALEPHAEALEAGFAQAAETMLALASTARGLVRVGAGPSMGIALLPMVAERLLAAAEVQMTLRSGLNDSLLLALQQGEIDFAVTTSPERLASPMLGHERLFHDRVVVVGRQGHALAEPGVPIESLRAARWVVPGRQVQTRARLDQLFAAQGLGEPDVWIETDSFPFMLEMIGRSDMLGYMPEQLIRGRQLVPIAPEGSVWRRSVGVSYWRRRAQTPASRMFLAVLRAVSVALYGE